MSRGNGGYFVTYQGVEIPPGVLMGVLNGYAYAHMELADTQKTLMDHVKERL